MTANIDEYMYLTVDKGEWTEGQTYAVWRPHGIAQSPFIHVPVIIYDTLHLFSF